MSRLKTPCQAQRLEDPSSWVPPVRHRPSLGAARGTHMIGSSPITRTFQRVEVEPGCMWSRLPAAKYYHIVYQTRSYETGKKALQLIFDVGRSNSRCYWRDLRYWRMAAVPVLNVAYVAGWHSAQAGSERLASVALESPTAVTTRN